MKWLRYIPLIAVLGGVLIWQGYSSTQAQVCAPQEPQQSLQYLRRLSLDLRGDVPSVAELQKVAAEKKVSESLVDEMLKTPQFIHRVKRYHQDLLWGNLRTSRFVNQTWRLSGNGSTQPYFIPSVGRRNRYRGTTRYTSYKHSNGRTYNTACLNEPAVITNGKIQTKPVQVTEADGTKKTAQMEGYVEVTPYWDSKIKVKVCAFDAQTAEKGKHYSNGSELDCSTAGGSSPDCGCGPNLRWCMSGTHENTLRAALLEQSLLFAADIVQNDRPYTDIVLAKDMKLNGPIAHYLKYQTMAAGGLLYATAKQNYNVPDNLKYEDANTWRKVNRTQLHAGVLTMPLFLLKFSSNRGRSNRFYNAFLCSHFQAPSGGLPPASDKCHDEPNLMKRCGCKYCHQTVEPVSAYWGRWAEAGLAPLNPGEGRDQFPPKKAECSTYSKARGNATCRRFYFIQPNHPDEEQYRGMLLSYVFATPAMKKNIEAGPLALAKKHVDNGDFAACTTRKMWTWMMGKAPYPQEEDRVMSLAQDFQQNNYNLKSLIKAIVLSPEYRQGRLRNN